MSKRDAGPDDVYLVNAMAGPSHGQCNGRSKPPRQSSGRRKQRQQAAVTYWMTELELELEIQDVMSDESQ